MRMRTRFLSLLLVTCSWPAFGNAFAKENTRQPEKPAQLQLIATAQISVDAADRSGTGNTLTDQLNKTDETSSKLTFRNDQLGGISAIAWSGEDDLYWFLPDRGPLDGAVDWSCRVQKFRVSMDSDSAEMKTELIATVMLKDQNGQPFTGLATAFVSSESHPARLDPEGIRVLANGNLVISDEYGPRIIEFTPSGEFVRELKVPPHLLISKPGISKKDENPKNTTGRATNRGMEGLSINAEGNMLVGLMQSPLLQDSFRKTMQDKPKGLNCRMPCMDFNGSLQKEHLYHLDSNSNKLNEILCCGPERFLVIERDGEIGDEAKFKKVMLISTQDATNIASVKTLPEKEIPVGVRPVSKTVLIDLLDPRWNLAGKSMPEKIESLAFGPDVDSQNRLLLVASDNDFESDTQLYAFAVPKVLLNGSLDHSSVENKAAAN